MKPDRIIDPSMQPDTYVDHRHGVKTRRELTDDQTATARRPIPSGVAIGNGTAIIASNVRIIHFTGLGVTISVIGDVATINIP